MRWLGAFIGSVVTIWGAGCAVAGVGRRGASSSPMVCPAHGGPGWRELKSAHFVLHTDLETTRARALLDEFEDIRQFFEVVLFPSEAQLPGHSTVVVFASRAEYVQFMQETTVAMFRLSESFAAEPTLVLSAGDSETEARQHFQHELTHRYVAFTMPGAPVWLNEGLAMLFETIDFQDGRAVIGRRSEATSAALRHPALPRPRQLMRMGREEFYAKRTSQSVTGALNYAAAGALVSTLRLGSERVRRSFGAFQSGLGEAQADWADVFGSVYGFLSDEELEREYQATLQNIPRVTVPFRPARRDEVVVRELSSAEVHVQWAALRDDDGTRMTDLNEALQEAPEYAPALVLRALHRQPLSEALVDARRAWQLAPVDPHALQAYAELRLVQLEGQPVSPAELAELDDVARQLAATSPGAKQHEYLTRWHLARGNVAAAVRHGLQAVRADASCAKCYASMAAASAAQGNLDEAAVAIKLAITLLNERAVPPVSWRHLQQQIAEKTASRPTQPPR